MVKIEILINKTASKLSYLKFLYKKTNRRRQFSHRDLMQAFIALGVCTPGGKLGIWNYLVIDFTFKHVGFLEILSIKINKNARLFIEVVTVNFF